MSRSPPALFRPRCCHECGTVVDSAEATIVRGHLTLDRAMRTAQWRGRDVALTLQQFEIVELLVQREGRIVQDWSFFVRVFDEELETGLLNVQVCKIRKAFRRADPDFDQLATVRGEGLMWRRFVSADAMH